MFEKDRLFATEGLRLEDNKELAGVDIIGNDYNYVS